MIDFLKLVATLPQYLHVQIIQDDIGIVAIEVFEIAPPGGWTTRWHMLRSRGRLPSSIYNPWGSPLAHQRFRPALRTMDYSCVGVPELVAERAASFLRRFIETELSYIIEVRDKPPPVP